MKDIADYIATLTDNQGVVVVTVSDGWVFTFTREKLLKLVETIDESDSNKLVVFVKSSADLPTN